jgi:hypothetical protein
MSNKYICKNNPAHTFTEPTADFWCPLCEKNTGMLELITEPVKPIEDDGKLDALNQEIESIRKEISGLNESLKDSESKTSENELQENMQNEIKELKEKLAEIQEKNKDEINDTSNATSTSDTSTTSKPPKHESIFLSFCFDGAWMLYDSTVEIYANDSVVGHGSLKNGFKIDFYISSNTPIIKIKSRIAVFAMLPTKSKYREISIPVLEFGKKYNVSLSFDRWFSGTFKGVPVSFREID